MNREQQFDRYLVGLPVAKCFEMFVADAGARIGQLVVATNARVARSLVLTWMENFEREMVHANESQKAIWTRLCESPDGNLNKQLFPYAVAVAFGSAKLIVHREFCFLDEQMALSVLRKASLVRHWPALRLLYIAMTDSNSLISHLPIEIISCVGKSISPHLFMKRISNSDH